MIVIGSRGRLGRSVQKICKERNRRRLYLIIKKEVGISGREQKQERGSQRVESWH